jgi:ABC-type branched-subunit amino acid transport system ATPase component
MLWASQVAPGNENGLRLRVYGEKGGLEWEQELPDRLWFTPFGEPKRLITRGGAGSGPEAARVTRIPPGHPEGYLEGFANIYGEAARAIRARRDGTDPGELLFPTIEDGVTGVAFIDACVRSSAAGRRPGEIRAMTAAPVLALRGVSRRFGPVQVLFDVDFDLRAGEVHALIGENGAGKSTTMKILGGYLQPSSGTRCCWTASRSHSPPRARPRTGDRDDPSGIQPRRAALGRGEHLSRPRTQRGPFLDHRAMQAESGRLLERLLHRIDPRASAVLTLSVPNKQMVEIAKALSRNARVLIMDEPTAVLTARETDSAAGTRHSGYAPRARRSSTRRTSSTRSRGSPTASPYCATGHVVLRRRPG